MTANQKKLINILKEMFQFNQADLDFGIYRIMGMKRDQITHFIEQELPWQITAGLRELAGLDKAAEIAAIDKEIADTKAASFSETVKTVAIAELEEKKKALAGSVDITSVEADVYNHLTNFFSRYYDDGDFISQRRYKDGVYAIPYEGEEVKLHWANADQYYVKTSEYFKDYVFKTMYGDTIRFKLVEAETDRDNNKSNEKRFFQLHTENPFALIDGELIIYVEYKNGGKTKQDTCIAEIVEAFSAVQNQTEFRRFSTILQVSDGKTLLERQLLRYTARNTFDYFIHKDLGEFLNRELDFYIKNDVIFLDDIDEQDEAKTKEYLTKAKVIRKIARKIIAFLAQIEDFQKKLYLKKKFVVETNYCITLDRVPEALYPEIAANDAQREEWVRLFAIDEISGGDMFTVPYSVPLTAEFLKANPFLVLDTAFFDSEFKEKLIDSIDGLDENLDGLMIHSENFQAINLLLNKYRSTIQYIYIDPPYNTDSTPILYKNGYRDSSWLSLMDTRLVDSYKLLAERGVYTVAIDDTEVSRLTLLMEQVFPNCRISPITVVHNPKGSPTKDFNRTHEYAIFATGETAKNCIARILEENDTPRKMRRWGENSRRIERPLSFYPIYIKNGKIVDIGVVPKDDYHPAGKNEICPDGKIAIWPIDQNGVERRWNFGLDSIRDNLDRITIIEDEGVFDLFVTHEMTVPKTVWKGGEYDAGSYGNTLLTNMLGIKSFDFPKSIHTVVRCVKLATDNIKTATILDFFAGSGTTGHAVINLNREDGGKRKYILVEMGEYFDTVTKPRIQKVIYSMDTETQKGWRDGKPVSRKGSSHSFKYIRLESYEDSLNNIVLRNSDYNLLGAAREDYMLSYMLDTEAEGASLLNIDALSKPFSYKMNITRNLASSERTIDLVETFNYLIGLTVNRSYAFTSYDADFTTGQYGSVTASLKDGNTYKFKAVNGTLPNGDKALIIWREMTDDMIKDNAALDAYFLSLPNNRSYRKIYVNCNNNLLNLRGNGESWQVILIDEEMKKRMFETAE